MTKICFVSFEIHPTVKGGAGVLLYNTARLLLSAGHEVIFLFDITPEQFYQFDQVERLNLPAPERCRAYRVQNVCEAAYPQGMLFSPKDFRSVFEFRSYRFHLAASQVYRMERPDVIEFFEYTGPAYTALCCKAAGLDYLDARLVVRMHGSLELIDRQQPGSLHGLDRYLMYNLERHALRLAENVLIPSTSFLEQAVEPYYEDWFGEAICSQPPLLDYPHPSAIQSDCLDQDVVLFYGRLQGIKGVDLFVDAAVLYLSDPTNPRRSFYMVGYDSFLPPGQAGSYQTYLEHKIPAQYKDRFNFTGQLSWQSLGELLPRTVFAVIPSYYESFCYAAHELYQAGVPLILMDLPAYAEFFQHEHNALMFDGSISDLARQMQRLSIDPDLRKNLSYPYPVLQSLDLHGLTDSMDVGGFYLHPPEMSWIGRSLPGAADPAIDEPSQPVQSGASLSSLLICILCDRTDQTLQTLQSLAALPDEISRKCQVLLFQPASGQDDQQVQAWFLGRGYHITDITGRSIYPTQVYTAQALLILQAGDTLETDYLHVALRTLQRQPQISYIGCYRREHQGGRVLIDTTPIDAALEIYPFASKLLFSRCVSRTQEGELLIDLFDPRAGRFGELAYLWQLDTPQTCGVMIPQAWIACRSPEPPDLESNSLDYLLLRDDQPQRKRRLARYLLSLDQRYKSLTRQRIVEYPVDDYGYWTAPWVKRLVGTRLNRSLSRLPWLKKIVRAAVKVVYSLIPGRGRSA